MIRSLDGGATWVQVTQDLPDSLIWLTVDPQASTTVYGVYYPRTSSASEQIYRTTDGGGSWSLLHLPFDPLDRKTLSTVAVSPSGSLYVGVWFDNVYETPDGGGSWEPLGTIPPGKVLISLAAAPGDPCRVYAATSDRGLLAFTESGAGCD